MKSASIKEPAGEEDSLCDGGKSTFHQSLLLRGIGFLGAGGDFRKACLVSKNPLTSVALKEREKAATKGIDAVFVHPRNPRTNRSFTDATVSNDQFIGCWNYTGALRSTTRLSLGSVAS